MRCSKKNLSNPFLTLGTIGFFDTMSIKKAKGKGYILKPKIIITRKLPDELLKPLYEIGTVQMWGKESIPIPYEQLMNEAKEADALLTMLSDSIDEKLLRSAKQLKIVANLAVGFDNIDIKAATNNGIFVTNTPDVLTDTTADLTFSLILMTARRLYEASHLVRTGQWKSWSPFFMAGTDVHHKKLGIVGMGRIAQPVAKRAKGFDMEISYYNRTRNLELEDRLGVTYKPFEDLIQTSDFIVNLTPLTEETKELFDRNVFKMMKNTAIFINAGRGKSVNEEDLYHALKSGEIAGCGLDVFEKEPIDETHPLLSLNNVVVLPHIGSASVETRTKMIELAVENIYSVLSGNSPVTLVNKELLK